MNDCKGADGDLCGAMPEKAASINPDTVMCPVYFFIEIPCK